MVSDKMISKNTSPYVLGLDLGTNSLGWAALKVQSDNKYHPEPEATGILAMGVRIFDAGMDGKIEEGREESRNVTRRQSRQIRRQLERAARRIDFIYLRMQIAGLLPQLPGNEWVKWNGAKLWRERSKSARAQRSALRHETLNRLDAELLATAKARNKDSEIVSNMELPHRLQYLLRTLCLDERMEPYAVGRALFHLAQRRGFLSNRKTVVKDDEESGKVKDAIKKLEESVHDAQKRTLGEFLLHLPNGVRLRGRWTSRAMYEEEFEAIWLAQSGFSPELFTSSLKEELHRAIFRQRPLKSQAKFIGFCEWEKDRRRAPLATLAAQRFRLLQQVNNIRIKNKENPIDDKSLSIDQRKRILERLENDGDLLFGKVKKMIGLKRNECLNLEEGGEKRLIGNRTNAKLAVIFGQERWRSMSEEEKNRVVEEWRRTQNDDTLYRRGLKAWGLNNVEAKVFSALTLEDGYVGLSAVALSKILPLMETGKPYMDACMQIYGNKTPDTATNLLPPVEKALPAIRNPTVVRVLTEMRTVVNSLIAKYGKPAAIRLELVRELRKGKAARQKIAKINKSRELERAAAREELILNECGIINPTRADIEKILLHKECKGRCPYTGKGIGMKELFNGAIQVEHIVPLSISLDDSFLNKTLCLVKANQEKGRRTPFQAFGNDKQRWEEITARVKSFQGGMSNPKVKRFLSEEPPDFDTFASQQLNDTSYAAKEALKYLHLLYGGEALRHVQAARGGVTAFLRNAWGLNRILGDGDVKNRDDHRHHAVDAVVIALTSRRSMKILSEAAVNAARDRRRQFGHLAMPWEGFLQEVKEKTDGIVISRRVCRKVSGPLHEATYYGPISKNDMKEENYPAHYHLKKPLYKLKAEEIEADDADNIIVDKAVRQAIQGKFKTFPQKEPKLFENDPPYLISRNGRQTPIKGVRVRMTRNVLTIGDGDSKRYAVGGNNHHAEIILILDEYGQQIGMDWKVVSMLEAYRRKKNREPIVKQNYKNGQKFLFSLGFGESIILTCPDNIERIFTCRGTNESLLAFTLNTDARTKKDISKAKALMTIQSGKKMMSCRPRKIVITPLGEIRNAND